MTSNSIITRIAPSPTGALHVGTARTALFNYLFTRHHHGTFILRIEDTDLERSDKKFEKDILEGLEWLGISWDGDMVRQSDRIEIYRAYLKKMWDMGKIFFCPHSEEVLEQERADQRAREALPLHQCDARNAALPIAESGGVVRFKNNGDDCIVFHDEIRGDLSFDPTLIGDFSVAKNFSTPLYNFAVVVDDEEMAISHVIRGEDHIANTPKQILIQQALGFRLPHYAHLPLILGTDRSKLSKRHGATSIQEYQKLGYLPEALCNFLALLGWNPGTEQELFSLEELVPLFSLERIQKSGAVFDSVKLDWMNGEYIRKKSPAELQKLAMPYLGDFFQNQNIEKILLLEQPRLKRLDELSNRIDYFFEEPHYDPMLLRWKTMNKQAIRASLQRSKKVIGAMPENNFSMQNLQTALLAEAEAEGDRGALLWPLRVALSGKKASPGPFEIANILGKKKTLARIEAAEMLCDTIKE